MDLRQAYYHVLALVASFIRTEQLQTWAVEISKK